MPEESGALTKGEHLGLSRARGVGPVRFPPGDQRTILLRTGRTGVKPAKFRKGCWSCRFAGAHRPPITIASPDLQLRVQTLEIKLRQTADLCGPKGEALARPHSVRAVDFFDRLKGLRLFVGARDALHFRADFECDFGRRARRFIEKETERRFGGHARF